MGALARSNSNRRVVGAMVASWCIATACGRVGYDEVEMRAAAAAGGGPAVGSGGGTLGASGTGIPPVTTAAGGASGTAIGAGGAASTGAGGGTAGSAGAPADGGSCPLCNPILYWKFDEASGTQAMDSSGHGFAGTFIGSPMAPSQSALVPPQITFADPWSRQFVIAKQQAVQLANAPAMLKPSNDITLTAWYRATATDTIGATLISMGDNYTMFLHRSSDSGMIELSKVQPQPADGSFAWTKCLGMGPGYLDGNWHHLAGVISSAGMRLYFDGVLIASNPDGSSLVYPLGTDLFVGMHGNSIGGFNFDGNIDDVRIYGRALSDLEIGHLAQGGG
jgi:hypothetical protein